MVFGRKTELGYLDNYYNREENELIVVYGHKNTGKAALLHKFCRDKDSFYYYARPCSEKEQIFLFAKELSEELPKSITIEAGFSGIISAMLSAKTEKRVIVIDEFQNIVKHSPDFMNELVRTIHNKWNNQPVIFILCSSSVYWVETIMVEKMGDAAYEISGLLKINELKFLDLVRNFKNYKLKNSVEAYAILGGIPGYWNHFDDRQSISQNVCSQILSRGAWLFEEGMHLLPNELREPSVYNTILLTLASGKEKLNDIYKHTGFSRAKISVYLKNLMEWELVEKIDSFETAGRENAQKGIYRISNHFAHFWYRYVYANYSKLNMVSPERFYRQYIEPSFQAYTAEYFKKVCTEYLNLTNRMNQLHFHFTKIGSWVGKAGTIDMVATDEDGHTLLGCCNWEKPMMAYADFEWFSFCAKQAKLTADAFYLFSAGTFDEKIILEAKMKKNIYLIDSTKL